MSVFPPTTFSGNDHSALIFTGKVSGLIIYAISIPDRKNIYIKNRHFGMSFIFNLTVQVTGLNYRYITRIKFFIPSLVSISSITYTPPDQESKQKTSIY
ncbi:hypothetical protein Dda3937_02288 [Dickeya dadantii 3937]|uniref:Uncharacterized protein n=1 Tax=Dickeya dadantii (strain 3937) TaxID=198628 RepID=E0SLR4_DICD3|nr:hypothetical protein Dda3937_02288 [Dickeya dadantii 3937]